MGAVVAMSTRIFIGVVVVMSIYIYRGSSSSSYKCAYL